VPRIAAATVAENRRLRERALVSAATSLLLEHGAFTVAQASSTAGISRPAFYEYFTGVAELTAVIVVREAEALGVELAAAVDRAQPDRRVDAWARTRLAQATSHGQQLVGDSPTFGLPDDLQSVVSGAIGRLADPLRVAMTDLGTPRTERAVEYVCAVVDTAIRRVRAGDAEPEEETAAVLPIIDHIVTPTERQIR
jgi:AcrR family transcriptional regulator